MQNIILQKVLNLDKKVYWFFVTLNKNFPEAKSIFEKITFFGSYYFVIFFLVFALIFLFIFFQNKHKKFLYKNFFILLISVSVTALAVTILKKFFERAGPPERIFYEIDFSFPSAHAAVATVLFGVTYFLVNKNFNLNKNYKKIYLSLTVFIIFLISLSRLVLQVHFFSDVIFGVLIGLVGILLGKILYRR